ncbi:MAG TPA: carboxylesterase/lipase family protein [Polyangiaceae bacterium]|nr:carboxylesterase/lipase family protein [Polyangiaceae bacterium]
MKAIWMVPCVLSMAAGLLGGCGNGDDQSVAPKAADAGPSVDGSVTLSPDGGDLTVMLPDGPVQGDLVGGSRRFLKIPYAKPPTGDLRWKAPVKNDPWTSVRHETDFASACPQTASSQGPMSTVEDCLYLNVWAPEPAPTKAPVMVWIHGGGNFAGSAADFVPTTQQRWYDGQFFASRHGVIVVTANYRLGPFGFFAHPELATEHSPLGNQGLLDQRRVFQWVQDNIASFGGDKANVTIFGESAGSADVCYHVASPGNAGLFQRAISESGGCTTSVNGGKDPTAAQAATGIGLFAKAMGCDTATDELACLRGKSVSDILANAMQPDPMSTTVSTAQWSFAPVVDGAGGFLPDQARTLYDNGQIARVPYILGSNNDEGKLFTLGAATITTQADYVSALDQRFPNIGDQVAAEYPASNFGGSYNDALSRAIGDSGLGCGTHDTARRAAKAGLKVFMYNFNMPWAIDASALGASHASEISHVFGDPVHPTADDTTVSNAMNAFWAQFAATGDPNMAGGAHMWPAFAPDASDNDQRIQFDPGFEDVMDFRKAECEFWRQQYDAAFATP